MQVRRSVPSEATIIRLPNKLKAKVCGSEHGGPGVLAPALLERAQAVVAEHAARYPAQAEIDMSGLIAASRRAMEKPDSCAAEIARVRVAAREIMGQGATFGYPLLTSFARSLYDFCEGVAALSDHQSSLLKAHLDAMQLVVRERVTGDGGEIGAVLVRSLAEARDKLAAGE